MVENSKIEWTDHTFNAWVGCTKVSPACDNCYAETWSKRSGLVQWGNHPRRRTSAAYWQQPLKWNKRAEAEGVRRRVFCCSLADVFDNQVDPQWRVDLWSMIDATPSLDWLLLTKRPQNIAGMMPVWWEGDVPGNLWFGTTVENQEEANRRIPILNTVPAAVRFLSCEPLLGPIDIPAACESEWARGKPVLIHWVIAGGESGPHRRPMDLAWMRSLRDQCARSFVPFFAKQYDKVRPLPDDLIVREFPR